MVGKGARDTTNVDTSRAPRAIFDAWPALDDALPIAPLGTFPTPVEDLAPVMAAARARGFPAWVKRDDVSAAAYGGNKVRTLEVLFGDALRHGSTRIYSTGAYGSNHAAATVLHARRAGLDHGVILFPQPPSATAAENLRVVLAERPDVVDLPHWSFLPFAMARVKRRSRHRGERVTVMVPGGATPEGALGYVSAALEVARQVESGEMPRPETVVIGVGSTCTSAGLLVGFHHAARMGIGFVDRAGRPAPPRLVSVRVTPWPVTAAFRIVSLAARASRLLAALARDATLELSRETLRANLEVDGRFLGTGYGHSTPAGLEAIELFAAHDGLVLDTTYSGKSAAALIARARAGLGGTTLFWSTKSTVPLPDVRDGALDHAPRPMQRYLARCAS